jgi:nucleoside-diphosphate-sugar epimerase
VVFHLAAHTHDLRSLDDSPLQEEITLGGTLAALSAAESGGVEHFVFASSLAVFGDVGAAEVDEQHPCMPSTPYGQAKLRAEEAVCEFAHRTGAYASSIRPAMIYGVGCPGNLPRMIRAVERRTFPPIPEFGNRRSMVAVADVVQALIKAWRAGAPDGRPYIVTDGRGYSTRELYDLIRQTLGRRHPSVAIPPIVFRTAAHIGDALSILTRKRVPFDSRALARLSQSAVFSAERAIRELGFQPTTTLPDLLPAMVADLSRTTALDLG